MALTDWGLNWVSDQKAGNVSAISLHDGDPGQTGANEISHTDYSRQTPSYNAASSGVASLSSSLSFQGPAGGSVTYIGFWIGTDFFGSEAIDGSTNDTSFNSNGEYIVDQADIVSTSS